MQADHAAIVRQLDGLLALIEPNVHPVPRGGGEWFRGSTVEQREMRTRATAAIERFAPPGSTYISQIGALQKFGDGYIVPRLAGILRALCADVREGYLRSYEELVHAEVFDDFLELANELSAKGFHAPAAVVAGAVLEEHLRKLATKNEIESIDEKGRTTSVETLSVELVKSSVFPEPQRKIVTGWYGQRTEAAHGRFDNVIPAEVGRMIDGIRDFIVRYPA